MQTNSSEPDSPTQFETHPFPHFACPPPHPTHPQEKIESGGGGIKDLLQILNREGALIPPLPMSSCLETANLERELHLELHFSLYNHGDCRSPGRLSHKGPDSGVAN